MKKVMILIIIASKVFLLHSQTPNDCVISFICSLSKNIKLVAFNQTMNPQWKTITEFNESFYGSIIEAEIINFEKTTTNEQNSTVIVEVRYLTNENEYFCLEKFNLTFLNKKWKITSIETTEKNDIFSYLFRDLKLQDNIKTVILSDLNISQKTRQNTYNFSSNILDKNQILKQQFQNDEEEEQYEDEAPFENEVKTIFRDNQKMLKILKSEKLFESYHSFLSKTENFINIFDKDGLVYSIYSKEEYISFKTDNEEQLKLFREMNNLEANSVTMYQITFVSKENEVAQVILNFDSNGKKEHFVKIFNNKNVEIFKLINNKFQMIEVKTNSYIFCDDLRYSEWHETIELLQQ